MLVASLPFEIAGDNEAYLTFLSLFYILLLLKYTKIQVAFIQKYFFFNLLGLFCEEVIDFALSKSVHGYFI